MLSRQHEHYRWAKYANASQRHNYIMLGFRCTELENNNFQTSVLCNYFGLSSVDVALVVVVVDVVVAVAFLLLL